MQPPAVVGNQVNPESTEKRKRLDADADMQGKAAAGAKPYQVRLKPGGEIAGGCEKLLGFTDSNACTSHTGHEHLGVEGAVSQCSSGAP
jgi:hypothetical protein